LVLQGLGSVAEHCVLEPELFLLQAVKQILVGVGAVLFLIDEGVQRRMLDASSSTGALSIGRVPFLDVTAPHNKSRF